MELPVHHVEQQNTEINNKEIPNYPPINNIQQEKSLIPEVKEIIIKRPTAKGKMDFTDFPIPKDKEFVF